MKVQTKGFRLRRTFCVWGTVITVIAQKCHFLLLRNSSHAAHLHENSISIPHFFRLLKFSERHQYQKHLFHKTRLCCRYLALQPHRADEEQGSGHWWYSEQHLQLCYLYQSIEERNQTESRCNRWICTNRCKYSLWYCVSSTVCRWNGHQMLPFCSFDDSQHLQFIV